ncbi:MAG: carboxypeptidase-like regulatory domain-containing protein, partial [Candidatus Acidiferrum sp.]
MPAPPTPTWKGVVREAPGGRTVSGAIIELRAVEGDTHYSVTTSEQGEFVVSGIVAGNYELSVTSSGKKWKYSIPLTIHDDPAPTVAIELSAQTSEIRITSLAETSPAQAGGEHLSKEKVSSLPLNERDFSKLLLLAAGTMT